MTGAEIDIVAEREGELFSYECKWSRPRGYLPDSFLAAYPGASFDVITRGTINRTWALERT